MNSTQMPVIQIKARNSDCFLETTDHDGNSDQTHQSISRVHQGTEEENHIAKMDMYMNENKGEFSFHTRKDDGLQEVMQINPDGISLLHSTLGKTGGISSTENGLCFYRGSDAPSPLSVADILINKDSDGQNVVKIGQNQNSRFEVKSTAVFHSSLIVKNENQEKLFECTPNGKVTIPKGELKIGNNGLITSHEQGLKFHGRIGIGSDPSKYPFPDEPHRQCYLKTRTGIVDDWFVVCGELHVGQFYGNPHTEHPSDKEQFGAKLFFDGISYNTDDMWIARYNYATDKSALRINIGDNGPAHETEYADTFEIGCLDNNGNWKIFHSLHTDGTAEWYDIEGNKQMVIKNGMVGIGKINPSVELDVHGTVKMNKLNLDNQNIIISSDTSDDKSVPNVKALKDYVNIQLPKGSILMWNGKKIPNGWALCDGTNDTPNLCSKFIYGKGNNSKEFKINSHRHNKSSTTENGYHNHGFTGTRLIKKLCTKSAGKHKHSITVTERIQVIITVFHFYLL